MTKKPIGLKDFKTEMVPIVDLIPYVSNPKAHPAGQVDKIASSIKNFGFLVPLVIDSGNEIVCGHGRLLAAQKLGLGVVPCVRADNLTPAQIKAFRLADNKVAESDWFPEALALELKALEEMDFDLELTGFDLSELAEFGIGEGDPDKKDDDKFEFRPGAGNLKLTPETELGPEQLLVPNPVMQERYADVETIVIQYSGGKDSSGALIWAKTNFPDKRIICCYVDTSVEFPDLAWHIGDVCDFFKTELEIVKPKIEWWNYLRKQGRWPSIIFRDCIEKFIKTPCVDFLKKFDEKTTLFCGGMRVEESVRGSKKTDTTSSYGNFRAYHPAFFLSKPSIEEAIKVSGMPVWRGYGQGFVRTACWCCPGMRGAQALALSRIYPGLADVVLWYEKNHLGLMRPNAQPATGFQYLVDVGKRKEERALKKAAGEKVHEPADDDEDPDVFAEPPPEQ